MNTNRKIYSVMLFERDNDEKDKWKNTSVEVFDNGAKALLYFANTPNPASQLISSCSVNGLIRKMKKMIKNYNNTKWLNENLYPYI